MRAEDGTYALLLSATTHTQITVGEVGVLNVRPGGYVYVGSAFGPGGVQARVRRHQRRTANPHWHIDYVRRQVRLRAIWYTHDVQRRECAWARVFAAMADDPVPLRGVGASDCSCETHLFYFEAAPRLSVFRERVTDRWADHAPIESIQFQGLGM